MSFTSFNKIFLVHVLANKNTYIDSRSQKISAEIPLRSRLRFTKNLGWDSLKISVKGLVMRSYEYLDERNGTNLAPRSSRDLTARSFENQLIGHYHKKNWALLKNFKIFLTKYFLFQTLEKLDQSGGWYVFLDHM
jgi:hypothetical protein